MRTMSAFLHVTWSRKDCNHRYPAARRGRRAGSSARTRVCATPAVGLAILYPFRCRIGRTAPSVAGLINRIPGQLAARGPVSASPSPMMHGTIRSGWSKAAQKACDSACPGTPPGKGELPEETLYVLRIFRYIRVNLAVTALKPGVGHHARGRKCRAG